MANSSKKKSGLQRGESKAAFLFCTPAVVLALVFIILPFAMSVVYSFTNKQLIPKVGMETAFVGLKNYIEIFTSKVTVLSFKNTFLYALIVVPSVLVIGTVLAVFVNQKIKGVQVFRLIYFSPQVVTMTVVAVIWAFIFSSKSSRSAICCIFVRYYTAIFGYFVSGSAAHCTSEMASGSASGTSVSGNYVYLAESWYADVDHFKWSAVHFRRTI